MNQETTLFRGLVFIVVFVYCWITPSPPANAQCDPLDPDNSIYSNYAAGYISGLPDGAPDANIRASFYSYEILGQGTSMDDWPHNGSWDFAGPDRWLINGYSVWYLAEQWAGGTTTSATACPEFNAGSPNNNMVALVAYDADLTVGTNDVQFIVYATDYDAGGLDRYEFDQTENGGIGVMQSIPKPTLDDYSYTATGVNVTLSWTEPSHYAYDKPGIAETMYGYQVHYYLQDVECTSSLPCNFPTSNDITDWIAVPAPVNGIVPIGTNSTQITLDPPPGNYYIYFALAIVGAALDSSGIPQAPGFRTGFVGPTSVFYVPPLPYPVPNGEFPSTPMTATRLTVTGDQIEFLWDTTTCPIRPSWVMYMIIAGDLDNVASYTWDFYDCPVGMDSPYTRTDLPANDLFFIITGITWDLCWDRCFGPLGNTIQFYSSWGKDSSGNERDGPIISFCHEPNMKVPVLSCP